MRKHGAVAFPEAGKSEKVYLEPNFETMADLFLGDPDVAASIEFIASVPVGNGFETVMDDAYREMSDGKTAKEVVDEQCKLFGFDELLQEMAQDAVGYGNIFVWKANPAKFLKCERIAPGAITKIEFNNEKLSRLHLGWNKSIDGDEVIWLPYNRMGKTRLGVGILQTLLTSFQNRPPFATIKANVQKAMSDQIENFSAYNEVYVFEGIPDADVSVYNSKIQQMKKGIRITTNRKAEIVRSIPERMRGLDFYVETLWNSFYLALKTPYPKLILGGGFTEASANTALTVSSYSTSRLQRFLKRNVETLFFDKWIEEAGLDSAQAKVRLNWRLLRMPDMSVLMSILAKLVELGSLKSGEMRKILADMGLPIEHPETAAAPATSGTPVTGGVALPQQPEINVAQKHLAKPREGKRGKSWLVTEFERDSGSG